MYNANELVRSALRYAVDALPIGCIRESEYIRAIANDLSAVAAIVAKCGEVEPVAVPEANGCRCGHDSDCAVHNAPAYAPGGCDCGFHSIAERCAWVCENIAKIDGMYDPTPDGCAAAIRDTLAAAPSVSQSAESEPQAVLPRTGGTQSVAVPDGWKLVPVEPTPEMVKRSYWSGSRDTPVSEDWVRVEVFKRMLHLSPQPEAHQQDDINVVDLQPEAQQPAQAMTDDQIMDVLNNVVDFSLIGECIFNYGCARIDQARQTGLLEFARTIVSMSQGK